VAYKIDPDVLADVARSVIDLPLESGDRFSAIVEELSKTYPEIIENNKRRWIGSRAGGILGKLTFLYISFTEYLLIFGCPAGTHGFSGRYNYMEIYKFVLAGQVITYDLESDQIAPTILVPGDSSCLERGRSRGLEIQSGSWHLEYGRGPNITALPFGLMDTLISSVELKSLGLTTSEYTRFIVKGLIRTLRKARR
jgi:hypothetical protein